MPLLKESMIDFFILSSSYNGQGVSIALILGYSKSSYLNLIQYFKLIESVSLLIGSQFSILSKDQLIEELVNLFDIGNQLKAIAKNLKLLLPNTMS